MRDACAGEERERGGLPVQWRGGAFTLVVVCAAVSLWAVRRTKGGHVPLRPNPVVLLNGYRVLCMGVRGWATPIDVVHFGVASVVLLATWQPTCSASGNGENRDLRRAQAHRAASAAAAPGPAMAPTHIAFISPVYGVPFFYAMATGTNTWDLPPGSITREATAEEQVLVDVLESTTPAPIPQGWVWRSYGVIKPGYWYNATLGRVQRQQPY